MANTRAAAPSLATVRTAVRQALVDMGAVAALQRWTNADIDRPIKYTLLHLQAKLAGKNPGDSFTTATMTVAAGADYTDIPAAAAFRPILRVELYEDTEAPVEMMSVPYSEIELYVGRGAGQDTGFISSPAFRWSIRASSTVTTQGLVIRPKPASGVTVRLGFAAAGLVPGVDADLIPLGAEWEELIVLETALRLRAPFGSATPEQLARAAELKRDFDLAGERQGGQDRIRRRKRRRRW